MACEDRINHIRQCLEENKGGNAFGLVERVKLIPVGYVDTIPALTAGTYTIDGDIVPKADVRTAAQVAAGDPADPVPGTWYEIDGGDTMAYSSEDVGEKEDGIKKYTVTGFIKKVSSFKSHILDGMNGNQYIAQVTDRNRIPMLFGDTVEGAKFYVNIDNTTRNGYPFTLEWTVGHFPYVYEGATATDGN